MFTRRRSLDRRRRYSREFLESLAGRLREAGFEKISIILPHNYPSVDPRQSEEPLEAFLERGRNFAAVILKAEAEEKGETLKLLFVNSNARAIFVDDTFPMAESEPSGLYFQSADPGRTYAVFEYFFDYLSEPPVGRFIAFTFAGLGSALYIALELFSFVGQRQGILQLKASASIWWDLLSLAGACYMVFKFAATPSGLWVKPKRELKVVYLLNMALKGQLRDNPLVQLIITVVGGLIVAGLAKWLGWF